MNPERTKQASLLRWGIVSTGRISHDFVSALKTLPANEHEIVAIAGRSLETAQTFATEHQIGTAYGTYSELALNKSIDIVYIGVINTQHYTVGLMMLNANKHVLCEKPLTMNKKHTEHLLKTAQEKGVFFMEAIWSRCFPAYQRISEALANNEIGDVHYVNVTFGYPLHHIDRVNVKELGGGAILDLGVYTLQFAQFIYRKLRPQKFTAAGFLNSFNVDNSASCIIQYTGDKTAVLTVSTLVELPNEAVIVGTRGTIRVPKFWCPSQIIINDKLFEFEFPYSVAKFNFQNSVGLSYEAAECRKCIQNGLLESSFMPHVESVMLAEQMDAWRKIIGVHYEEDTM